MVENKPVFIEDYTLKSNSTQNSRRSEKGYRRNVKLSQRSYSDYESESDEDDAFLHNPDLHVQEFAPQDLVKISRPPNQENLPDFVYVSKAGATGEGSVIYTFDTGVNKLSRVSSPYI